MEYSYEDLESAPNQEMLLHSISISKMEQTEVSDISYHSEEHWLKVWFEDPLSDDDKTILDALVSQCLGVVDFQLDTGSEFFELIGRRGSRWEKHRRRVRFDVRFKGEPKISVSNVRFDGVAKFELVQVTERNFDFRVTAVGTSSNSKNASLINGLTTIEFDWEAKSWE